MQSLQADQSLYNRKGVCYIVQLSVFRSKGVCYIVQLSVFRRSRI